MQPLVAYPYCNEKEEHCQEESRLFSKSGCKWVVSELRPQKLIRLLECLYCTPFAMRLVVLEPSRQQVVGGKLVVAGGVRQLLS